MKMSCYLFTIYQNCSLNLCWFLFWILGYGDASSQTCIYIQLLCIRKGMYIFSGYFGGAGLCTSFCCTHSEEDMHVAETLETLRYPKVNLSELCHGEEDIHTKFGRVCLCTCFSCTLSRKSRFKAFESSPYAFQLHGQKIRDCQS